jgi:hypothetical protein
MRWEPKGGDEMVARQDERINESLESYCQSKELEREQIRFRFGMEVIGPGDAAKDVSDFPLPTFTIYTPGKSAAFGKMMRRFYQDNRYGLNELKFKVGCGRASGY